MARRNKLRALPLAAPVLQLRVLRAPHSRRVGAFERRSRPGLLRLSHRLRGVVSRSHPPCRQALAPPRAPRERGGDGREQPVVSAVRDQRVDRFGAAVRVGHGPRRAPTCRVFSSCLCGSPTADAARRWACSWLWATLALPCPTCSWGNCSNAVETWQSAYLVTALVALAEPRARCAAGARARLRPARGHAGSPGSARRLASGPERSTQPSRCSRDSGVHAAHRRAVPSAALAAAAARRDVHPGRRGRPGRGGAGVHLGGPDVHDR